MANSYWGAMPAHLVVAPTPSGIPGAPVDLHRHPSYSPSSEAQSLLAVTGLHCLQHSASTRCRHDRDIARWIGGQGRSRAPHQEDVVGLQGEEVRQHLLQQRVVVGAGVAQVHLEAGGRRKVPHKLLHQRHRPLLRPGSCVIALPLDGALLPVCRKARCDLRGQPPRLTPPTCWSSMSEQGE